VYDMYHWDEPPIMRAGSNSRQFNSDPVTQASAAQTPAAQAPAAQAVQVALDRRDNGGDSSAARDQ
jgi:hypothetical protein